MFRTELVIAPSPHPVTYQDSILTLGSCFSQCMGRMLEFHKFKVASNPFGTVFNPQSVHTLLRYAADNHQVSESELTLHQELWSHYDFHSSFSSAIKEEVVKKINAAIKQVSTFLEKKPIILLTYGTAMVHEYKDTDKIVSNCHKHPSSWFNRRLLSVEEIVSDFTNLKNHLGEVRFIITVSPVRHTRDTLPLNNVSKSTLRLACHHLSLSFDEVEYFPSQEIMLDDLRDYRFYSSDMIHPSGVAEEYIWIKFCEAYFSPETRRLVEKVNHFQTRMEHQAVNPNTKSHKKFLRKLQEDLGHPDFKTINFSNEKALIEEQLKQD
jgi:hypothetical protein